MLSASKELLKFGDAFFGFFAAFDCRDDARAAETSVPIEGRTHIAWTRFGFLFELFDRFMLNFFYALVAAVYLADKRTRVVDNAFLIDVVAERTDTVKCFFGQRRRNVVDRLDVVFGDVLGDGSYFLQTAKLMQEQKPNLRFQMLISPFIPPAKLVKALQADPHPAVGGIVVNH
mgnify:CR=1 FL=1